VIQPIELGKFRLYALQDGSFHLDAGSMYGIVPKTIWMRSTSVDDKNRMRLGIRPLLVEAKNQWILIDTGIGDKFNDKYKRIYGIDPEPTLDSQLAEVGISKKDISVVINSHLHWDHAGGNTQKSANDDWEPAFVNARYVVQRGEYEFATHLNERTRGSYRIEDYVALEKAGCFDFADGDTTIMDGVRVLRSGGHIPYHQCVYLESDSRKAFFLGDLLPLHTHLHLPYILAFDLEPLVTLEKKREYLERAVNEDWLLFFVHDPEIASGRVELMDGQFRLKQDYGTPGPPGCIDSTNL
jgi:glyoxylase-like metal-dependent hydrolase (beta-lactamase superfamily II)